MNSLPPASVHLITHRRLLSPDARTLDAELHALERFLDEAIAARVDVIQIRERDVPAARIVKLAGAVAERARPAGVRVLVNDRADVAAAAGADGVHLRADSAPSARVRTLGSTWTIGRSIHAADDPAGPGSEAIDYWLFAPVFAPVSKAIEPGGSPAGVPALARAVAASPRPVVALGGIDAAGAAACAAAGAAGVAAVSLFLPAGRLPGALGPDAAVRALRRAFAARSSTGHVEPR